MKRVSVWVVVVLSIIIVGLLAWLAYLLWWSPKVDESNEPMTINSFETCVAAGNVVMEIYPRQCRDTNSGVTYTEDIDQEEPKPGTISYRSDGGVTLEINNWVDNMKVVSPLTITGRVPGSWSFEANFPVQLLASDGSVIAETPATLEGDWMTSELVPFTATLSFDTGEAGNTGSLILRKSNPSDLPENADSLTLPVRY